MSEFSIWRRRVLSECNARSIQVAQNILARYGSRHDVPAVRKDGKLEDGEGHLSDLMRGYGQITCLCVILESACVIAHRVEVKSSVECSALH